MLKILCITGWGVGVEPLQALQQQFAQRHYAVDVLNIFDADDPPIMQQHLELVPHYDVLMGWSLGGQLATLLAEHYRQHTGIAKTLISLATQPCFVAHADWPEAMPSAEFAAFQQSYQDDALSCIKRFCYLITQLQNSPAASAQLEPKQQRLRAKADWLSLQSLIRPQPRSQLETGLHLLQQLNLVEIWKNYPGQQLHLYADQDALIKAKIVQDVADLAANQLKVALIQGSHAFPVFNVEQTLDEIVAWLGANLESSTQITATTIESGVKL